MLQEVEEITQTTRKLKINIPSDVIEEEIARAYNKLRASVKIPGFRVGKVPQAILEKKFAKDVEAQVIEKVVPKFYSMALKEAQIIPVGYPSIAEKIELVRNQPLSFTVTVEVKPKIEDLTYEGIELKEKTFSIEEKDVEATIKVLQEGRALFKVSEDAIKEDDMAIIDYDAFIDDDAIKELSAKDYPFIVNSSQFTVNSERTTMNGELTNALLGKKKGDTLELKIYFDNTHPNKTIAGNEVLFKISITEVKRKFVPALDNEFIKSFDCKDLDELKKKVYDDLYKKKKNQTTMEYKKELLNILVNSHNFEIPSSMLENELEILVHNAKQNATQKGEAPRGDDELRQVYKPIARGNVKGVLVLEAIGKKEKIEVGDEDVNKFINDFSQQYNLTPEEVKRLYIVKDGSLDGLKNRLYADKVLDFVLEKAVVKKDSEL